MSRFFVPKNNLSSGPATKAPNNISVEINHFKKASDKKSYDGHRKRAKQRSVHIPHQKMSDEDILELVLFHFLPRIDVKPIAQKLLENFSSFSKILQSSESSLKKIDGIGDSVVQAISSLRLFCDRRLMQSLHEERNLLNSIEKVIQYLKHTVGFYEKEEVRILFLDSKFQLISEECTNKGTIDQTTIYIREIIQMCFDKSASAIILSHNHPSGDPSPSDADITSTNQLIRACESVNIQLIDHIIISSTGYFSFRENS